jgi:hypothetical protein
LNCGVSAAFRHKNAATSLWITLGSGTAIHACGNQFSRLTGLTCPPICHQPIGSRR